MAFTQHRKVQMSDEQHGIVTSFSGAEFLVDLVACTCTCGRYQVNNIPCGHAVPYCQVTEGTTQLYPRNFQPTEVPTNITGILVVVDIFEKE
jgi:hypothetical protein